MKLSITHKLFIAILTAASLAVVSLVLIMQWNLNRGFLRYLNALEKTGISRLVTNLEQAYGNEGSWSFLQRDPSQWRRLIVSSLPEEEPAAEDGRTPRRSFPRPVVRQFAQRLFLLDAGKRPVVANAAIAEESELTTLSCQGSVIGYLGLLPRTSFTSEHQQRFLRQQRQALVMVAGVIVVLAGCLSLMLAKRLVRPLAALATATDHLAAGDFATRVPTGPDDELGRLARDFNTLALVLEKNEQARRQWVADVSHELRTPLAVLRGEIEAIQDGIRQPTAETIQSLHGEVLRLGRLVDDLYQLSLSDLGAMTYRKANLDLVQLLLEALAPYEQEFRSKGITMTEAMPKLTGVIVHGDQERLHQLFANLLSNALKYTDSGGTLRIALDGSGGKAVIDFQDSAPGVPEGEMEKLFDRLYRVESSRNRATGGAGLGLAICRNIAEAHGGTIMAQASPLGGLWIRVELPLAGAC